MAGFDTSLCGSVADLLHNREEENCVGGGRIGVVYGYRIDGPGTFGCDVFAEVRVESATAKSSPPDK